MTLAKYCYHYLKDKVVICSFIGPSFHQAIISHALRCHQSLFLQLSMANPIEELEDEDQHLNLGGCLRSKQAISILWLWLSRIPFPWFWKSATCKSSLYRWIFRAMFLSVPWRISFLKYLYGYLGRSLASQYPRVCYFIKAGFICCSA
ncbi:hypothetical protein O0I10_006584 [Lichtheimia ornata]|uniref:Uncharacterized protein n=1 Tax=Lichtheimia ornata TaxID=688661 RepID=A0AAD7XUR5_9FUNG|nr:uncharacterized protein O0I10_006584 [Lichtheimia ornata]KAJ8657769.1 hypothetical protein O0I10_006584 [Lichtheimia ornata]